MTSWTTPRTWSVGELVTKAIMDTHVRDNLLHLKEQVDASLAKEIYHSTALTNTSWDGDAKSTGNYDITATSFNGTIPSGATAVLLSLSVKWASASDASYCNIYPKAGTGNGLVARAQTTFFQDAYGWVGLDGSGRFTVTIGGANATAITINVWGWRL